MLTKNNNVDCKCVQNPKINNNLTNLTNLTDLEKQFFDEKKSIDIEFDKKNLKNLNEFEFKLILNKQKYEFIATKIDHPNKYLYKLINKEHQINFALKIEVNNKNFLVETELKKCNLLKIRFIKGIQKQVGFFNRKTKIYNFYLMELFNGNLSHLHLCTFKTPILRQVIF